MSKHTFLRSAIATLATLIATGLPLTSSAHAVDSAAGPDRRAAAQDVINTFRNRATGRCLDDSGAGLRSFACNGLNFQQWKVTVDGFGHRTLQNVNTGRCLDDSGAGLRAFPCNGLTFQKWNVTKYGNGIVLANHETKRCVDDSGAGLRSFACNGLDFQRWY
ncbi:RICIN domain-containing protein [Nonomuraea jabiensis]|uniref:RICIN domain-containing protein n=1 Tax=Nonomuraea jabiensis TaxID=882448 RepID=UPI003D706A67